MPTPLELRTADKARKDLILQSLFDVNTNSSIKTNMANNANIGGLSLADLFAIPNTTIRAMYFTNGWRKAAKIVFCGTTSPTITVKTTTGYARALRWDGTLGSVSGTGDSNAVITINFGTAPATPYNTRIPKFLAILPTDSLGTKFIADDTLSYDITYIVANNANITALDISALDKLEYLSITDNNLISLNVSNNRLLKFLDVRSNNIKELNLTGLAYLEDLSCSNNLLTSIDFTGCVSITRTIDFSHNLLDRPAIDALFSTLYPVIDPNSGNNIIRISGQLSPFNFTNPIIHQPTPLNPNTIRIYNTGFAIYL